MDVFIAVKAISRLHDAFTARVAPQWFVNAKFPVTEMLLIASGKSP
jgi:hypothetical protein